MSAEVKLADTEYTGDEEEEALLLLPRCGDETCKHTTHRQIHAYMHTRHRRAMEARESLSLSPPLPPPSLSLSHLALEQFFINRSFLFITPFRRTLREQTREREREVSGERA